MAKPSLPNFSFVIEKELAGCGLLGYRRGHDDTFTFLEEDLNQLKAHGVTAIVSLTEFPLSASFSTGEDPSVPEKKKLLIEKDFQYLHLPIQDQGVPSIKQFVQYCEFVKNVGPKGGTCKKLNMESHPVGAVVTHCFAGRGRTGTMLAAYLVHQGMNSDEAIQVVRQKRPHSIETRGQEEVISQFESFLKTNNNNPVN